MQTPLQRTALAVVFLHLAIVVCLCANHILSGSPKKNGRIAVRTLPSNPSAPVTAIATKSSSVQKIAQSAKPSKPKTPAAPTKPKPTKTAKVEKKKAPQKLVPAPVKEIEESLAVSNPSPPLKSAKDLKLPSTIAPSSIPVSVDAPPDVEADFATTLVQTLQQMLYLPETGDVKAKISLSNLGQILSIEILDAKSAKNVEWLKNELPQLSLPCFNDFGIASERLEFVVTFTNAEQ